MGKIDIFKPWVILPLKTIKTSNSRLTPILSPTERQQLSLSMLEDVLDVLRDAPDIGGLLVITSCPIINRYVGKLDVTLLEEGNQPELNSAIIKAVQFLRNRGIRKFFTIPGDVPLLNVSEVNQLTKCVRSNQGLTLVPSHDGVGTNSIGSSIPILISTQFGNNSLSTHRRIAEARGLSVDVVPLSGLGFDIDWPSDLVQLASKGGYSKTHSFLNNIDVVQRRSRLRGLDHNVAIGAEQLI